MGPRFRMPILGVVAVALLSGCYFSPRTESELMSSKIERDEYWTRSDGPILKRRVETVAIAEFGVEFVTHKMLTNGPGAAWVDPTQFVPWGIALKTLGLGRRRTDFGSDTGRIRSFETHSHPDLPLIVGTKAPPSGGEAPEIVGVDAALMKELGADLVIRVRFRIGVHNKLASIERDSVIAVTADGTFGSLVSRRSLTSDDEITADCGFLPIQGILYEVDAAKYRPAIKRIMALYLDLLTPEAPSGSLASR